MKTRLKNTMELGFTPEEKKAMDTVWEICDNLLAIMEEHKYGQMVESEHCDIIDHDDLTEVKNFLADLKRGNNWDME